MRVVILTVRGTEAATRSVLFLARISLDLVTNRQDRRHTTATALASRTCIGEARRQGVQVSDRRASPKVLQACQLMRQVLLEQIASRGELVAPDAGGALASGKGEGP